jgi:transcriptional regulator with XRE-family HTH domain
MRNFKNLRLFSNLTQEDIAKKLKIKATVVSNYETGSALPSFNSFLNLVEIFNISFDFLVLDNNCLYPKNLKLLKLAKELDNFSQPEPRSHIEISTKNFLIGKNTGDLEIKQDFLDVELSNNFHDNLKIIRNSKDLSQLQLSTILKTTTPAVTMYEKNRFPSVDKLLILSEFLKVSIHALATGDKLFFDFQDRHFGRTMLLADQLLTLEEHKILITLMETIIKNSST